MSGALHIPAQATLDSVNELLKTAMPVGAYCIGIVCGAAWKRREEPPRAVLEALANIEGKPDTAAELLLLTAGVEGAAGDYAAEFDRYLKKWSKK